MTNTQSPINDENTITLDAPIKRGESAIETITLRKPNAGELRGINLAEILQLNAGALLTLLPRITAPSLTPPECAQLDPADLIELGTKVAGFFIRKSIREEFQNV